MKKGKWPAGRVFVGVSRLGQVHVAENGTEVLPKSVMVATTPQGCRAVAEALLEAAKHLEAEKG